MEIRQLITPLNLFSLIILGLACVYIVSPSSSTDKSASKEEDKQNIFVGEQFSPTNYWQSVKKGQPIPKGLHVRINLETGITEAKLLDQDDKSKSLVSVSGQSEIEEIKNSEKEDSSQLYDISVAMKKITGDYKETEKDQVTPTRFRTYSELKEDLEKMHMKVKSDMELLKELTLLFPTSTDEAKVSILTDLEYMVHQIDNAQEFARLNGFIGIINPCFNSTNADVRSEAIKLLGSAVQSNLQVQISASSSGSIQLLLRAILHDQSVTVKSRALYALSCLIRNFPAAQIKMVAEGGLVVLARAFDTANNIIQFQVKVVTLLNDLLEERQIANSSVHGEDQTPADLQETLDQYKATNLEQKLVEAGWCMRVPKLLLTEVTIPDNDVVEKVLNAMQTLFELCGGDISFQNSKVIKVLGMLETWYKTLSKSEDEDYFRSLSELVVNLRRKLILSPKHEL